MSEPGRGPVLQPGGQRVELFAQRGYDNACPGLALIRDGNGTRSFETLLRYRGAAMAEFWRALKTLKALQAEQAAMELQDAVPVPPIRPAARPGLAERAQPNEAERRSASAPEPRLEYLLPDRPAPGALHEPGAPWQPNEPEPARARREAAGAVRASTDRVTAVTERT